MSRARIISLCLAAFSIVGLGVAGVGLARRIDAWHEANPKSFFYSIRTDHESFEHAGREVVFDAELAENGDGVVTVRYGDETTLVLPVEIPNPNRFPGLDRYIDWMQVFFLAENAERLPFQDFREAVREGTIPTRCVIVTRAVDPVVEGKNPLGLELDVPEDDWGYGEVLRSRWRFTFYELMADGTIETSTLRMPESGASLYRRQVRAYQAGDPIPQRGEGELRENTWQWDLALQLMPRPPAITKENQALLNAGWTLPVASGCVLILSVSLAFAFAPRRADRWTEAERADPGETA